MKTIAKHFIFPARVKRFLVAVWEKDSCSYKECRCIEYKKQSV